MPDLAASPGLDALRPSRRICCAPEEAAQLPTRLPSAPSPPEMTTDVSCKPPVGVSRAFKKSISCNVQWKDFHGTSLD